MALSRIAREVKTSATLAITAKAKQLKAKGVDVIGFGAGEPDFDIRKCKKRSDSGNQRWLQQIYPYLRRTRIKEAICEKLLKDNKLKYNPSQIIVSAGAKQSILNTVLVLCDTGDEAIIPTPIG